MTEATKHTPGPWEAFDAKDRDGDVTISIRGGTEFIATMETVSINGSPYRLPPSAEANARLIAAAPELLAALHLIVECADADNSPDLVDHRPITYHIDGAWIDRARAAIAKATGRE